VTGPAFSRPRIPQYLSHHYGWEGTVPRVERFGIRRAMSADSLDALAEHGYFHKVVVERPRIPPSVIRRSRFPATGERQFVNGLAPSCSLLRWSLILTTRMELEYRLHRRFGGSHGGDRGKAGSHAGYAWTKSERLRHVLRDAFHHLIGGAPTKW